MSTTLEKLKSKDHHLVAEIFASNPDYFKNVEGSPSSLETVQREIDDLVPKKKQTESYQKGNYLFRSKNKAEGFANLHINHPEENIAYIGLFVIHADLHNTGIGKFGFTQLEKLLKDKFCCNEIRLGISENHDSSPFWSKMGFSKNNHSYTWTAGNTQNQVFEMSKSLT